jgi:hypothetical protein
LRTNRSRAAKTLELQIKRHKFSDFVRKNVECEQSNSNGLDLIQSRSESFEICEQAIQMVWMLFKRSESFWNGEQSNSN